MVNLNASEKFLINRIRDSSLQQSVMSMRDALLLIWKQNDAPILIRDFVHHNILHSQKMAYFAEKIIKSNRNLHLKEKEVYLLLASIYLHDIGMQCELYKFPEIKKEAERLGAKFSNEYFTQRPSSELSPEEQKELRNNHQFVSAAWIGFSYLDKETKTLLHSSAKTIPDILIEDIKNICMYHSKLDITKCNLINVRYSNIHVQLIAAILRYCDELDIERDKVNIDVVNSFQYDAERVKYHHMHTHTCIDFQKNAIKLTVALHPEDIKEISIDRAYDLFIQKFIDKNKDVQKILQRNDVHIYYDGCDVLEDINSSKIPNEVLRLLIDDANGTTNKNNRSIKNTVEAFIENLDNEELKDVLIKILISELDEAKKTLNKNIRNRMLLDLINDFIFSKEEMSNIVLIDAKSFDLESELVEAFTYQKNNESLEICSAIIKEIVKKSIKAFKRIFFDRFNVFVKKNKKGLFLKEDFNFRENIQVFSELALFIDKREDYDLLRQVFYSYLYQNNGAKVCRDEYDNYFMQNTKYIDMNGLSPKVGKKVDLYIDEIFVPVKVRKNNDWAINGRGNSISSNISEFENNEYIGLSNYFDSISYTKNEELERIKKWMEERRSRLDIENLINNSLNFDSNEETSDENLNQRIIEYIIDIINNDGKNYDNTCFIEDIVFNNQYNVILGSPGSGKSTALKFLARKIINLRNSGHILQDIIPIYIRISDYAEKMSNYIKLYDFIIDRMPEHLRSSIEKVFNNENVILFLDALDEVIDTRKKLGIIEKIMDLLSSYSHIRCVVSSRIVGYSEAKLSSDLKNIQF